MSFIECITLMVSHLYLKWMSIFHWVYFSVKWNNFDSNITVHHITTTLHCIGSVHYYIGCATSTSTSSFTETTTKHLNITASLVQHPHAHLFGAPHNGSPLRFHTTTPKTTLFHWAYMRRNCIESVNETHRNINLLLLSNSSFHSISSLNFNLKFN